MCTMRRSVTAGEELEEKNCGNPFLGSAVIERRGQLKKKNKKKQQEHKQRRLAAESRNLKINKQTNKQKRNREMGTMGHFPSQASSFSLAARRFCSER